jgi:four helix bundle protein
MNSYRELAVWKKGMGLAKSVYTATGSFPDQEKFGLSSQMRRAAVSIPSNIAEGNARRSTADYVRFLNIAQGSCAELETQVLISADLGFLVETEAKVLVQTTDEIGRMLTGLVRSLKTP